MIRTIRSERFRLVCKPNKFSLALPSSSHSDFLTTLPLRALVVRWIFLYILGTIISLYSLILNRIEETVIFPNI